MELAKLASVCVVCIYIIQGFLCWVSRGLVTVLVLGLVFTVVVVVAVGRVRARARIQNATTEPN